MGKQGTEHRRDRKKGERDGKELATGKLTWERDSRKGS